MDKAETQYSRNASSLSLWERKRASLKNPCQAWTLKSDALCSVVGTCKPTCECIFLNSGPVRRKWKSWKCVFVCRFGVPVMGFKKAKGCGILSGDHPSYESGRLAEALLYLDSWGKCKSPEVRTSVSRLSCRLNISCVFKRFFYSFFKTDMSLKSFRITWVSVTEHTFNWWWWHLVYPPLTLTYHVIHEAEM